MTRKSLVYNPDTKESFEEAKVINGNPSGIINLTKEPFKWVSPLYLLMQSYTWYTSECNLGQDAKLYASKTEAERYAYDMVLGQLIGNDSIQTKQLPLGVSSIITSPAINSCINRQAYEENEHAVSYTTAAEDVCQDSDRIYELHKHEPALRRKNDAVAKMYDSLLDTETITTQDKLKIFAANQILEELVFPGGFVVMWSLDLPGTNKMISFIERDESGTHVPLFKNIMREAVNQVGMTQETEGAIIDVIKLMTAEEILWTSTIAKGLLGFSDETIRLYVEDRANSVCKNLRIPLQFEETDGGPLMSIYKNHTLLGRSSKKDEESLETKSNFFETAVADYDAGRTLDEDY